MLLSYEQVKLSQILLNRYMQNINWLAGLILLLIPVNVSGNFFKDYLKDRYPIRIVSEMPENDGDRILMISTRNLNQKEDLVIKKGLDPHYRLTLFIASLRNDTALILPLKDFNEISPYLSAGKDFLVLVDGHGKTFGQSMERGFQITRRFKINTVVFDWPTDYIALWKTIQNASDATISFVMAMRNLDNLHKKDFPKSAVSVIFHSMGNRIIKEISSTKLLDKMPDKLFSNIILNAAAVKQFNHAKWVEKLDIQKRIYITMNDQDLNLRGAAIIRMAEQLGMTNKSKTARNAFYVNFSELATIDHNLFLGRSELDKSNPMIYAFYDLAFHGKQVILGANAGFQILGPSDRSFLSVK